MQCQICNKRTATIHLTEITEGMRTEMHVCEHCAAEQGIASQSQMSINELLTNFLASQPSDEEILAGSSEPEQSCSNCGFTLGRLRKEGTLGCPHDYEVFEQALMPLIERAHNGRTTHCGKVPTRVSGSTKKLVGLSHLRQQLEVAIRNENYEQAAELRDKMKHLE
jgi:protein arginine kinase activator